MEVTNQNEVKTKVELRKRPEKFKMIITASVEQKIRMACAAIPNREWSGVLFCTYKGDFEHKNLQVTCKDILVMDVGTATYTEWCADAEVVRYMAENDLLDCQMAIIHSHNTMATFFSGTDTATLLSEGQDRNNLVSLIVNNEGTYSAAITRCVISEAKVEETGTYQFFGEGERTFSESYETEDIYIEYFMFDIIKKEPKGLCKFINRLKEVMTPKPTVQSYSTFTNYAQSKIPCYEGTTIPKIATTSGTAKTYIAPAEIPARPVVPIGKSSEPVFNQTAHQPNFYFNQFNPSSPNQGPKDTEDNPDELVDLLVLKLVTGNIFADFDEYADLDTWIKSDMFGLFHKRFGSDVSIQSDFSAWLIGAVEFLLFYTRDGELEKFQEHDRASILAEKMYDRMKKFPIQNIYIKAMMSQLHEYYEYTTI